MIAGHHQHFLDAVLVQQREHLILGRVFAHRDQPILRRHHGGYRRVELGFEAQIAMRHDADHLGAEHHRHPGDVLGAGQFDDLRMVMSGLTVIGSLMTPLSNFLTRSTCRA